MTAILVVVPSVCFAAELSPSSSLLQGTPSLADLQHEAEERNPTVQAAAARVEAARRTQVRATTLPDPEVALTYVNDGVSSFTLGESEFAYLGLTWTQELPYAGKRKHAGAVADTGVERAAAELRRARLETRTAVGRAYAEIYRIDQASSILHETASILDTLAQAARSRYEVGGGIQENVLKAETGILRLQAEQARLEQDRVAAVATLASALGRASDMSFGEVTVLPPVTVPTDADAVASAALASAGAVEAARAGERQGEASVAAAQLETRPDWLWSAGYQNRGGLDPMVMGMIGLRLPVYGNRKQHQTALEAEDQLRAARNDLAAIELKTAADARAVLARARRADRLVELYEKGVIVQARAAVASAQSSYGVGRIDFLDLLNDLTVLLGVRIEAVAQEAERLQAVSELEGLTGLTLIETSSARSTEGGAP